MARKKYTSAQITEAVALGRVVGAETAGEQLGIDRRTIRGWMEKAGDPPELRADGPTWERLRDLAMAKAEAMLSTGKLSAVQVATMAGIATRNADKAADRAAKQSDGPTAAEARDAFFDDWLIPSLPLDLIPDEEPAYTAAIEECGDAFGELQCELLRRANAELPYERAEWNPTGSHRLALLAWHNHNPDIPAGDILEWAKAQTAAILEAHGSLLGWYRWTEAVKARDRVIRERADVLVSDGGMRHFEAEPFVREHLADDLPEPVPGAFA